MVYVSFGSVFRLAGGLLSFASPKESKPVSYTHLDVYKRQSLALVVFVMLLDAIVQFFISYTFAFGELQRPLGLDLSALATAGHYVRMGLMAWMAVLWMLNRKRTLVRLVIFVNAAATLVLILHVTFLCSVLAGLNARIAAEMLADVVLMAVSNMLIFSVWYWVCLLYTSRCV